MPKAALLSGLLLCLAANHAKSGDARADGGYDFAAIAADAGKALKKTGSVKAAFVFSGAEETGNGLKKTLELNGMEIVSENLPQIPSPDEIPGEALGQLDFALDLRALIIAEETGRELTLFVISSEDGKKILKKYYKKVPASGPRPAEKVFADAKNGKETGQTKKQERQKPEEKPAKTAKRNFAGFLAGAAGYSSDFKDFKALESANPGARYYENSLNAAFEFFYKRKTGSGWEPFFSAGISEFGNEEYVQSGNRINLEAGLKYLELGCAKRLGRLFSLFAGAGADFLNYILDDPVPISGIYVNHGAFEGSAAGAHARAGVDFTPGNFIFRLGAKKIFFPGENRFSARLSGSGYPEGEYSVIIRNGSALDYKKEGEALAGNEKYLEAALGGLELFFMIGYGFSF